ncbi:MAG: sporulation protein [Calditrichaeota bacterium]|nr:sporulation protein [Calditrichota bacterium]
MTNAQEIIDTILSRLKGLASTETVVGQPVTVGNVTLLPVIKVSIGFAAGSGEGSGGDEKRGQGSGGGGGGGGGASVQPVGFLAYDGEQIRYIPVGKGKLDALLDTVPEILQKLGIAKGKDEKKE